MKGASVFLVLSGLVLMLFTAYVMGQRRFPEAKKTLSEYNDSIHTDAAATLGKQIRFINYVGENENSNLCFAYLSGRSLDHLVYVPCERIPKGVIHSRLLWVNSSGGGSNLSINRVFDSNGFVVPIERKK